MNPLERYGPLISHAVIAFAACLVYGEWLGARHDARISKIKETYATEKKVDAEDATKRLQAAQDRGDQLSKSLQITQDRNDQLRIEVHLALNKKTTGHACLNEPTLRVLSTAPGITVVGLPEATSGVAAAGEVTATDSDIAHWAADAGAAYRTCSARLDALIDWYTGQPK